MKQRISHQAGFPAQATRVQMLTMGIQAVHGAGTLSFLAIRKRQRLKKT